jgi:integrase
MTVLSLFTKGDTAMALSDTAIKNAKLQEKQYKIFDEKGLYVLVNSSGKYFRFDFRFNRKRKTLALGVYPDVTLKQAREKRDDARSKVANGIDPTLIKKIEKKTSNELKSNSFEFVAREWFTKKMPTWERSHSKTIIRRLEANIFPWLGNCPVSEIKPSEILECLRRIEERNAIETAHRVHQITGQIFRYAVATGRCERDPSGDLKGAIPPTKPSHMATITDPEQIGALIRAISGYKGYITTKCALMMAPLVFVRPGELRHAEWNEINFEQAEWKIPAQKMKIKTPHIVPLSTQALRILADLRPLTGRGKYIFPSLRSSERPMSSNTVLAALRRMGYQKDEMSGHGFRAMASTILHEKGWRDDCIERQLAHAERNKVEAAYNYAQHLSERKKMMQFWSDYLDEISK